jgi:hypothetical protein
VHEATTVFAIAGVPMPLQCAVPAGEALRAEPTDLTVVYQLSKRGEGTAQVSTFVMGMQCLPGTLREAFASIDGSDIFEEEHVRHVD